MFLWLRGVLVYMDRAVAVRYNIPIYEVHVQPCITVTIILYQVVTTYTMATKNARYDSYQAPWCYFDDIYTSRAFWLSHKIVRVLRYFVRHM